MPVRKWTVLLATLLFLTICLVMSSILILVRSGARQAGFSKNRHASAFTRHFMMVCPRTDSSFWQEVFVGADASGALRGAIVEMIGPSSDADRKSIAEYIEYAVAARADGIIAWIDGSDATKAALQLARQKAIPVVSIEYDAEPTLRQSFVGVNSYELGRTLGALVRSAAGGRGRAAVLLDRSADRSSQNIMLSAMQESLAAWPSLVLVPLTDDRDQAPSREDLLRGFVLEDGELKVIVCLNVEDTLRAAQTLVELNRSGRVRIIAFRESREILDYLRKGVVSAVVAIDARQMGGKAADSLADFLETGHANDYVITDMHVSSGPPAGTRAP